MALHFRSTNGIPRQSNEFKWTRTVEEATPTPAKLSFVVIGRVEMIGKSPDKYAAVAGATSGDD